MRARRTLSAAIYATKPLILLFVGIALGSGILLWRPFSKDYYSSVPVTFGKYDYPFITTEFQNQNYALVVDVGSRFPLALRRTTLDTITDKQSHGTTVVQNIHGQKYEVPSYLISKLKVGNMTVENVIAYESQEEDYDTLGQFFGKQFNLLVDFPHSRIIACDSFAKLEAKKLVSKHWVRVPFELHRSGIILYVDTDCKTRKLVINTTSTVNLLSSSVMPQDKPFASAPFILGGKPFGNVTFESINLPDDLLDIDGFIGMEFLKEHAIYLDYTNKIAYVEPTKKYFERIPVLLDDRIDPIIDVSIQGHVYPLRFDLGSSCPFALREEILYNLCKIERGNIKWHDFRGRQYQSTVYSVPEVKIGNLIFTHALVKQDNEDFNINVALTGSPLQLPGVIGLPILEKYNLLLDFPHSAIYASSDLVSLQEAGLLSKHLLTVPFTPHPDGILLFVETDVATYRLIVDTGSTCTAVRGLHPTVTGKFRIGDHDFGERVIRNIDMNPQFEFDGCLGMDFLREHPIFIDYSNKTILIDLQ